MKTFVKRSITVAGLAAVLLLPLAYAGDSKPMEVKVPFNFMAAGTECPAGAYTFTREKGLVEMTGADGQVHLSIPVITFIARSSGTSKNVLAFDKVGPVRTLSEVWLPNAQGALVHATEGEHDHELVRLNRTQERAARAER